MTDADTTDYASPSYSTDALRPDSCTASSASNAWNKISRWRQVERKHLLDERLKLTHEDRQVRSVRVASLLDLTIGRFSGRIIGTYWPCRGELDLRNWGIRVVERGGRIALPVVVQKDWPLEYRIWTPGDLLVRGVSNILIPAHGPAVQPDVVIAPVVGFDDADYRLGYGGGFFNRTLAIMPRKPLTIGVGYAQSRILTVYPQPHDIPMDVVVTD